MDREEWKSADRKTAARRAQQKKRRRTSSAERDTRETEKKRKSSSRSWERRKSRPDDEMEMRSGNDRKAAGRSAGNRTGKGKSTGKGTGRSAENKKKKRKAFDAVSTTILIVAVCVFVFSLYQLVMMLVPYYTGSKEYDKIQDVAITADEDGSGFHVDFDTLLEMNPDTVAWIRFDEPSSISYPVVKSADNNEYLTKSFSENDNKLGTIFVDMNCSSDFSDRNTLIYGHNLRLTGRMFSQLLEYEDESFYKEHPYFYIYTPDGKVRTYTIFAASVVQDTSDNYTISYDTDADYESYLELCRNSSLYDTGVEVNAQSQIVSLSTCTNGADTERFLLQGVLTAVD